MEVTLSGQAQELIAGLLTVDPTKRFDAERVLAHPWIRSCEKLDERLGVTADVTERVRSFGRLCRLRVLYLQC